MEFALPDPGEGLPEAEIVAWRVHVGDTVAINDVLVDIETAKSLVELPSPAAGTIEALLVREGDIVPVGMPIVRIDDSVKSPANPAPEPVGGSAPVGYSPVLEPVASAPKATGDEPQTSAQPPAAAPPAVQSTVAGGAAPFVVTMRGDGLASSANDTSVVSVVVSGAAPRHAVDEPLPDDQPDDDQPDDGPSREAPRREEPADSEPVESQPVADEPAADKPVAAEPVVVEPVVDEPPADEAVVEESVTDAPAPDEPVSVESAAAEPAADEPAADEPADDEAPAALVGYGTAAPSPVTARPDRRSLADLARRAIVHADARQDSPVPADDDLPDDDLPVADNLPATRPLAKPAVRSVARELGVELASVHPSGPGGLVTVEDILFAADGQDERIPLRGVRRQMFATMTSMVAVPQATIWLDVDVTATLALVASLKRRREFEGMRVSPLLIVAKAACLAIGRTPDVNVSYDAARDEIVRHRHVDLGIAAATPRGLVVPAIKQADRLSLPQLASAFTTLIDLARQGKARPEDLGSSTFTITNVGALGVTAGTPILNQNEATILCMGAITRRPWVVGKGEDERIVPRSVCTLSLTLDHRLLDGDTAASFLTDIGQVLTDPALSLLF